jgi:hypothetical protein
VATSKYPIICPYCNGHDFVTMVDGICYCYCKGEFEVSKEDIKKYNLTVGASFGDEEDDEIW